MKAFTYQHVRQGLLLASALLLAGMAFAANKGSFELMHPTHVGDKDLAPGTYTVQWEGSGDQVQLNILEHNKTVTSVPGHIMKTATASPYTDALVQDNPDGSKTLTEIRFRGKNFVVHVDGVGGGASGASGAAR